MTAQGDYYEYLVRARKHLDNGDLVRAGQNYQAYRKLTGRTDSAMERALYGSGSKSRKTSSGSGYSENAFGIGMSMMYVRGGEFLMGGSSEQGANAERDEKPLRNVTVSDFYIGKFEVTQAQWEAVMGTSVVDQRNISAKDSGLPGLGADYPMYYVNWEEAEEFCRRLSRKTGRNYRLPTEAEWEYAARGGEKSHRYRYAGGNDMSDFGWHSGNAGGTNHPVGTRKPNELGIYDMCGNVWEWCSDWYASSYDAGQTYNPKGPYSGEKRTHRGGSWRNVPVGCRVSERSWSTPAGRCSFLGFRVVCIP